MSPAKSVFSTLSLRTTPWLTLSALALLLGLLQACSPQAQEVPVAEETPSVAVARGRVDVEGGLLKLAAPVDGVVAEVSVREGDTVTKGQLLAALQTKAAELSVAAAQAALAGAQAQAELGQVRHKAAAARAQRLAEAAAAGVAQGQDAQQAQVQAATLKAQAAVDQAAVAQARQQLAQAQYAVAQRSILAPQDATVVRVMAQAGTLATAEQPLFVLLPNVPRIVRAELNESYVDAVKVGMWAQVEARDGKTHWPAQVLRVGQVYQASTLAGDHADVAGTRVVECVLSVDAADPPAVGRRVTVRIFADDALPESNP